MGLKKYFDTPDWDEDVVDKPAHQELIAKLKKSHPKNAEEQPAQIESIDIKTAIKKSKKKKSKKDKESKIEKVNNNETSCESEKVRKRNSEGVSKNALKKLKRKSSGGNISQDVIAAVKKKLQEKREEHRAEKKKREKKKKSKNNETNVSNNQQQSVMNESEDCIPAKKKPKLELVCSESKPDEDQQGGKNKKKRKNKKDGAVQINNEDANSTDNKSMEKDNKKTDGKPHTLTKTERNRRRRRKKNKDVNLQEDKSTPKEKNVESKEESVEKKEKHTKSKTALGVKMNNLRNKFLNVINKEVQSSRVENQKDGAETTVERSEKTKRKETSREPKTLRQRMEEKLKGARFRYLNEQMYSKESRDAKKLFVEDPKAFTAYHDGYRQQIDKWPLNPLDVIIKDISNLPKGHTVADFGCGDARLSKSVPQKVFSFDLVALDPCVQACDMSHTPLLTGQVDVVVFCLSLMGTNLKDYIVEANRVLKPGGVMKIAEVESRFDNVEDFTKNIQKYGFKLLTSDLNQNLFYFMDFKKESNIGNRNKLPQLVLKACLYKKR